VKKPRLHLQTRAEFRALVRKGKKAKKAAADKKKLAADKKKATAELKSQSDTK